LSALKKHVTALHSRHGQVVHLQVTGSERRLPAPVEDAAFGIVQEALNNIVKHASSTSTQVHLRFEANALILAIIDAGVGFDPSATVPTPTLGMSSMRERAEGIGGRLVVTSAPGRGTRVSADLPIRHAA
jgi:signal transduction histidine kinase